MALVHFIRHKLLNEAVIRKGRPRSCLTNDNYSDNVKALELLNIHWQSMSDTRQIAWDTRYKRLFRINLGRQEWAEAENLVTEYAKSRLHAEAEMYADLGELQIRQGKLVDGETTLRRGVAVERTDGDQRIYHLLCLEQLMVLYMQQERWTDAEEVGLDLIRTREDQISRPAGESDTGHHPWETPEQKAGECHPWDTAKQKATQIIKMSGWRGVAAEYWSVEAGVYYLHALYNNKHQLAMVCAKLNQYNKAQRLLEELMEEKMHIKNPILVASKELLVTVYIESGKLDEAEKRQEKTIEEMSETFGYDSEKLIPALEKLAHIYQKNNHLGKRHHVKIRLLRYR